MIVICKFCQTKMIGEFETLGKSRYRFFFTCPKCKSVYEGIRDEQKRGIADQQVRWFNPTTQSFEDA